MLLLAVGVMTLDRTAVDIGELEGDNFVESGAAAAARSKLVSRARMPLCIQNLY